MGNHRRGKGDAVRTSYILLSVNSRCRGKIRSAHSDSCRHVTLFWRFFVCRNTTLLENRSLHVYGTGASLVHNMKKSAKLWLSEIENLSLVHYDFAPANNTKSPI